MLMIVVALGALLPLIYGMYWQIGRGEPWGNEPMSDNALIGFTIYLACTVIGVCWILLSTKLQVRVDAQGIHYKFFPTNTKWRLIGPHEIDSFEIRKKANIFDIGIGLRRHFFTNTKSMNINASKYLRITLTNRERIVLGVHDREAMERAMKKLLDNKESN